MTPKFSVVLIAKNEAETLPRLIKSLAEFQRRGGEVVLLDTGSTDGTRGVARSLGCKDFGVGARFVSYIPWKLADRINERFIVDDEAPIVAPGDSLFDYSAARNHAASLALNDIVSMPDCDETFTNLDIDYINDAIARGIEQMEFNFIFAHDPQGRPAIKFVQCKMYDRRKFQWRGVVHEVLHGEAQRELMPENVLLLEHWQNPTQERSHYLRGLAVDCYRNPENDRNSHYLGRELLWTGRPKSAIRELERHVAMNKWDAERAQSYIFMGDAYGLLNQPEKQAECFNKAIYIDPSRREAFLRLAGFYQHNNRPPACAAYAAAALQIPWHGYYANHVQDYEDRPHAFLYWAKGWMGDIPAAKENILKALEYQPYNPIYARDMKYYFGYDASSAPEGWMSPPELLWLYQTVRSLKETCA